MMSKSHSDSENMTAEAAVPPQKPAGFSRVKFLRDPMGYAQSLNKREAIRTAKWLDYQYHVLNKSIVSDEAHDILVDSIRERWPSAKYLKRVGHKGTPPTVKQARNGVKEVRLPVRMPSLDKIKPDTKNLDQFLRGTMIASDKLDGISLLVEYKDGRPVRCFTRGDGHTGNDVSGVIPALNIPKTIPEKGLVYVRCEFLIKGKKFTERYSKHEGKGEYKTARNMGGGLLTRNKPSDKVRDFDVVAYEICRGKGAGQKHTRQFDTLKTWGFTVVRYKVIQKTDADALVKLLDRFKKTAHYAIDGIVVAHDKPYQPTKTNPKHAKAFKVNSLADSVVVEVKDVEWNRSRHNKLAPRVIIDPTMIGGVEVSYFTAHNYFYVQHGFRYQDRNKKLPVRPLGKGAKIRAVRSGDVIPYILEVVKPARRPAKPDVPFKLDKNGVHAYMESGGRGSEVDDELKKKRIVHFLSVMKMKGVKTGLVDRLYASGITTISKLIKASPQRILRAENIKEKTAENVVASVRKGLSENATFARVAYASSVFGSSIGERVLQSVIDKYPNIMHMAERMSASELEEKIRQVDGIQSKAQVIAKRMPRFLRFLERTQIKLQGEVRQRKKSSKLSGVKVLFTSVRDEDLLRDVLANGGQKASSVKSATHLIVKPGASNNKTAAAQDAGIPILTIDEFRRKFKL